MQRYKPDPETYLSPAKFFALERSEVMMVAAHQTDLRVPKELRLRTAYTHHPYERGHFERRHDVQFETIVAINGVGGQQKRVIRPSPRDSRGVRPSHGATTPLFDVLDEVGSGPM